jgi:uncharacterized MnhB-related membrane protein
MNKNLDLIHAGSRAGDKLMVWFVTFLIVIPTAIVVILSDLIHHVIMRSSDWILVSLLPKFTRQ